jgi:hypothetical protein
VKTLKPSRFTIVAIGEWAMVLPATVLVAAATLRLLQPRQYEPARTSWVILQWTTTHISRLGAAMLFIGMPGIVATAGCATLLLVWREDEALRHDAVLALTILRRRLAIGLLTAATLLAGTILLLAVVHVVTD